MLQRLSTYYEEKGEPPGRFLPHHIAVCVTKFDAPEIFYPARAAYWGTQSDDGHRFPVVKSGDAAEFFRWACEYFGGNAEKVRDLIDKYFDPGRTHYFVTSAIGFYLPPDRVFRPGDFSNVKDGRIRGDIHPINALEPFIALDRAIRAAT
jgi:hypothetical protein